MYVLDTDVFSISNSGAAFSNAQVEAWRLWVARNEDKLFLSVVTIMEVRFGIEKSLAKGATQKAERLRKWLAAAQTAHRDRIIPVTTEIAHKAGQLLFAAYSAGAAPSSEDAIIAASGDVYRFRVLSRNAKDMKALGAIWSDPLELLPPDAQQED